MMVDVLHKTKDNAEPKGKPRVYFSCHPDDFEACFEKLCSDIFKSHDCAVYYTKNMGEDIPEQEKETVIYSNNLVLIPVTMKLLTTPNRAMDMDLKYALEKHIPILPVMMEPKLEELYSLPEKFGKMQFLNSLSTDKTEIPYEEKLKKYLDSVLIDDETQKRIRAAFDAYIFLSYRKKDRKYANELIRIIHRNPECRDIAIWFDEFLTPGENFSENISKNLNNSKLFTLLVTPNLLEEPKGEPNFIMREEYPLAKERGIEILPAEMEETDKDELNAKFNGIPACVDARNDVEFKSRFLAAISKVAVTKNDDDPGHNFLIGLAYLEGIDMEVDREKGMSLITSAAKDGLPEAMEKLYDIYVTRGEYKAAVYWMYMLSKYYFEKFGQNDERTAYTFNRLAIMYMELGEYRKALKFNTLAYSFNKEKFGEEHSHTLTSLGNIAACYSELDETEQAFKIHKKVYNISCRNFGEDSDKTMWAMSNLATCYIEQKKFEKALEMVEKAHKWFCKSLGEEHHDTLTVQGNIAYIYGELKQYEKEVEIYEKVYAAYSKTFGEEHPESLCTLSNLALAYKNTKQLEKAVECGEKSYSLYCKYYGEEHPRSLNALNVLITVYTEKAEKISDFKKLFELAAKSFDIQSRQKEKNHPLLSKLVSKVMGFIAKCFK